MAGQQSGLEFDELNHAYRYNGIEVPSVTQIIDFVTDAYKGVPQHYIERARERGEAVHKATEYYDNGELDWSSLDDEQLSYLEQYIEIKEELGIEVLSVEERLASETHWVAGTLDRRITIKRPISVDNQVVIPPDVPIITDLKCTYNIVKTIGPQTAAYSMLAKEEHGEDHPYRLCLWLNPKRNQKAQVIPLTDPSDVHVFTSMMILYKWRQANGV